VPLARAFWHWAVLVGLPLNLLATVISLLLLTQRETGWALVAGHVATVPYNILVAVGVWRAAARYAGPRLLADLARALTLAGTAVLSVV
jgi:hypothetical protein